MTLAEMEDDLSALRKARATGARRVSFSMAGGQQEVDYRNDAEMLAAIHDLERRIAEARGRQPVRLIYINASKGA